MLLKLKEKSQIIEIKHNLTTEKIPASGIKWIEAMGDYFKIITLEKKYFLINNEGFYGEIT